MSSCTSAKVNPSLRNTTIWSQSVTWMCDFYIEEIQRLRIKNLWQQWGNLLCRWIKKQPRCSQYRRMLQTCADIQKVDPTGPGITQGIDVWFENGERGNIKLHNRSLKQLTCKHRRFAMVNRMPCKEIRYATDGRSCMYLWENCCFCFPCFV